MHVMKTRRYLHYLKFPCNSSFALIIYYDTLLALQNFLPIAVFHFIRFGCIKSEGLRCPDEMGRCNAVAFQASHHGISPDAKGLFSLQDPG